MVEVALSLTELSDEQLVGLLRVQHGAVASAQALELATMAEVSRRTLAGLPAELADDAGFVDGLAEMESGAALACTANAAASQLDLAEDLIHRPAGGARRDASTDTSTTRRRCCCRRPPPV